MKNRGLLLGCWLVLLGSVLSAESPIRVDNSYADWQSLPSAARFSTHFSPFYFESERDGKSEKRPIEEALYWKKGGTQITELKAYRDTDAIYLYLEAASPFARELSIFLYVYPARDAGEANTVALELLPSAADMPGSLVLWQQNNPKPSLVGKMASTSIRLECAVPLDGIPRALSPEGVEGLSFDLVTCYHEYASGLFEEFFFTTIYLKDVVKPGDL